MAVTRVSHCLHQGLCPTRQTGRVSSLPGEKGYEVLSALQAIQRQSFLRQASTYTQGIENNLNTRN